MSTHIEHTIYVTLEPYCALCRKDLPESFLEYCIGWPLLRDDHEQWEKEVITCGLSLLLLSLSTEAPFTD